MMATKLIRRYCTKIKATKDKEVKDDKKKKEKKPCLPYTPHSQVYLKGIEIPKTVKVSLQNANCKAGKMAAFLLKQHPLIGKVYLHGDQKVLDIAADLNCIDSNGKVEAYHGSNKVAHSLRAADIAILLDSDRKDDQIDRKYKSSASNVVKFAKNCSLHCPRAMIVVCVEPLCCMVPLVQNIIDDTPWFHPSKLLGSILPLQARINTIAANFLNLNPLTVHVPLLGGPDAQTTVPILSLMTPDPYLAENDMKTFYNMIKTEIQKRDIDARSTINEGYAAAKMAITIAKGLCGHNDAISTVFSRTNILQPLKYFTTTVKFSDGGIYDNYGLPKITRFELENVEESAIILQSRQKHLDEMISGTVSRTKDICC